jgi:site-specific DNA-methyltransferase (adenine-specific)|tara:strand:- start:177 stop:767 length:591 start_codon:yes stop_codon:yes gene_type:complete
MEAMKEMSDNQFDLAIVDPPYRNTNENQPTPDMRTNRFVNKQKLGSKPNEEFFKELRRVSRKQIIWGANNFSLDFKGFIVWDKVVPAKDKMTLRFSAAEIAALSENISTISKIFTFRTQGQKRIHPTQKPVELYEWTLMTYAKEGYKILDTHLGSGSLAIACHNLGYDFTGYEIDEEYFEAAKKRIEQHTAQKRLF